MPAGLFDLTGSVALITGSSQGLGFEIARGLAKAGATVALNGRDSARLAKAAAKLEAEGAKVAGFAFDVTNSADINAAIANIQSQFGCIDVLVNNAGIQRRGALETLTDEAWQEVLEVNLTGAFKVARSVAIGMIKQTRGKIINICSLMSELGRESTGAYAAAKGGLKMLTRAMAVEWAGHNIQVNGLGPGYFITPMTQVLADTPAFDHWLKSRTPAGRWGKLGELVGPAVFLASRAANFVNGQVLYVDGGILATL